MPISEHISKVNSGNLVCKGKLYRKKRIHMSKVLLSNIFYISYIFYHMFYISSCMLKT